LLNQPGQGFVHGSTRPQLQKMAGRERLALWEAFRL
jgi:hypothetical protein